jgi:hypothetical protein
MLPLRARGAARALRPRSFASVAPASATADAPPPSETNSSSSPAAASAPAAAGTGAPHVKIYDHFKRASRTMAAVNLQAWLAMQEKMARFRPPLPDFRVGDAVEISYAHELNEARPMPVRGTVIAKQSRGLDSKFTVLNVRGGGTDPGG